jgi:hypothetical protein
VGVETSGWELRPCRSTTSMVSQHWRAATAECCTPLTRLALMNLLEAMLNVEYLYLRHTSSRTTRSTTMSRDYGYHGHAPIVGFATVTMTWSKTALYFIQGEHEAFRPG